MGLYKTLRIDKIKSETEDCKTFYMSPADGAALAYQPGQFLTFVFPKPAGEERRSYSLSSTPVLQEPLSITVKRLENGEYSRKLFDYAKEGDELTTTGAAGFFVLPDDIHLYKEIFLSQQAVVLHLYSRLLRQYFIITRIYALYLYIVTGQNILPSFMKNWSSWRNYLLIVLLLSFYIVPPLI